MTEREQRLREIEARVEAVTPGPWKSGHYAPTEQVSVYYDQIDEGQSCIARTTYTILDGPEQSISDMKFVAHARQDVPWLLAEVRRLEKANLALSRSISVAGCSVCPVAESEAVSCSSDCIKNISHWANRIASLTEEPTNG